jgi:hypothetical protein
MGFNSPISDTDEILMGDASICAFASCRAEW